MNPLEADSVLISKAGSKPASSNMFASIKAKKRPRVHEDASDDGVAQVASAGASRYSGTAIKKRARTELEEGEVADSSSKAQAGSSRPKPPPRPANRTEFANLESIAGLIQRTHKNITAGGQLSQNEHFNLRGRIQMLPFYNIDWPLIYHTKLLERLALIIDNPDLYPADVVLDAKIIRAQFARGDYENSLTRGLQGRYINTKGPGESKKRWSWVDIKDWPHRRDCKVVGANGLFPGMWWPLQQAAKRDGAHGEIEAGICNGKDEKGQEVAYSVILSGGPYKDMDVGNRCVYYGTKGTTQQCSTATQSLLNNMTNGIPVRLLRSSNAKNKDIRPKEGLRYDGLYKIVKADRDDDEEKRIQYKFQLERLEDGQEDMEVFCRTKPDIAQLDQMAKEMKRGSVF